MTRPRLRSLPAVALVLGLALLRGDGAGADPPRSLAGLLPARAVAVVEADDLRALLRRWKGSALALRFGRSDAARDLEKSRLYLRLERNVAEIEELAGFGLDLDRLIALAGHRSAIALYDVPSTSFVAIMELSSDEARASDWLGQRGRLSAREHRGVPYLVGATASGRSSLAVALVGERLVAGTDLDAFRGALVLAARAAGVKVAPPAAGQREPEPLGADPRHRALVDAAPAAPLALWVSRAALTGHYFDDYWLFGPASARGIDAAWVALAPGETTAETRLYLHAAGTRPSVAVDGRAVVGAADVPAAVAPLPGGGVFSSARPTDAADAAATLAELIPRAPAPLDGSASAGADAEAEPDAKPPTAAGGAPGSSPAATVAADAAEDARRLASALAAAAPRRAVELVAPRRGPGGAPQHHAAVALGLAAPTAFDAAAFERALVEATGPIATGAAFSDDAGCRALHLPLVPPTEWGIAYRRAGAALVVATDAATCAALVAAVARPDTARLLAADGPRLYRLDVAAAGAFYRATTALLAARDNWSNARDADLLHKSIGGLFHVVEPTTSVTAYGYARGAALYVEEVRYR